MAPNVFAVPVFLVVFRETLETAIIVSVLLAFLKQTLDGPHRDIKVYKSLRRQVWIGTGLGFLICMIAAGAIIGVFYTVGRDAWQAHEYDYEGAFCLFASVIITFMGAGLLRIGRMQEKWRVKLAKALNGHAPAKGRQARLRRFMEKYIMFFLPFITVLREGIEAIVFVAGVSFSGPATAIPLPVVVGLIAGGVAGYALYKGGSSARMQLFLVASTCLLYIVAAGLFSRAVWSFETQRWNDVVGGDAAELGSGPGSYDIDRSVWHVNCCSPELNGGGGWGFLNAIFGWNNSATYGSVISYNVYWIFVIAGFLIMAFHDKHGRYPFMKASAKARSPPTTLSRSETPGEQDSPDKAGGTAVATGTTSP